MQGDYQLIFCFWGMIISMKTVRNYGRKAADDDDDDNTGFISPAED